ncbi:MAG TPA: Gfo/Idh/MocA family oxidoreductase [Tepidisphaeraceae bacterium]|jgi:predicted dehydrogenase
MPDITRRSFLEHTLVVAAAGLTAANVAKGADDVPKAVPSGAGKVSRSDRIGIAVIGLHGRGKSHLDAYTYDDNVEVVAICDVDEAQFGNAQTKLAERGRRIAKTYQDIRKLLEDKDVQAVSIATPNHWHALAAIWAMQSGRDAYVEKPASHNVTEGRRLEQIRAKFDRICQVGTQSRSDGSYKSGIQYIHEGHIGKVLLSRGLCYKRRPSIGHFEDSSAPATLAYDTWLGPAPKRPFNKNRFLYEWHWNWDYGNGDIGNQGVHQMDIARWALNKALPHSVIGLGGRFGYQDDGQTPNTMISLFDYGDAKLMFEVRGLETTGLPGTGIQVGNIVYGTEGFVAFSSSFGKAVAFDITGNVVKTFKGSGSHFSNFVSAVKSHKQSDLNCPILEGHYSAALCHLANISYRLGEPLPLGVRGKAADSDMDLTEAFGRFEEHLAGQVDELKKPAKNMKSMGVTYQMGPKLEFDPKAEHFGANTKANQLLTREYRAPFVVPASA